MPKETAKRGRPPLTDADGATLDVRYNIRCTEADLASWREAADRDGRSVHNWIRRVLNRAAKP